MAEYEKILIEKVLCPAEDCPDPSRVRKDGFHGGKQRYECGSCGKKFKTDGHALHRQYTAQQIAAGIDAYFSGMSYKEAAEHIDDYYDAPEPSKHTIHDWVKGYSKMAQDYLLGRVGEDGRLETASGKHIKAKTGYVWVCDETYILAGGEWRYCWNIMDRDSRYILAVLYSPHRGTRDAIAVMEKALAAADRPPKKIITDGLDKYPEAIRTVFPRGTEHVVSQGITEEVNNNLSERLQGTIKDRTKVQRGFQGVRTGQDCLEGWAIDYNFFNPHHSLGGKTPAEVAGVASQVPWNDSWEDITRMGGEVAEAKHEVVETKRKESTPRTSPQSVAEAAARFIENKRFEEAKAKRKNRNSSPAVSRTPKWTPRRRGGRGRMRI